MDLKRKKKTIAGLRDPPIAGRQLVEPTVSVRVVDQTTPKQNNTFLNNWKHLQIQVTNGIIWFWFQFLIFDAYFICNYKVHIIKATGKILKLIDYCNPPGRRSVWLVDRRIRNRKNMFRDSTLKFIETAKLS